MIDVSKLKPGDQITVRARFKEIGAFGNIRFSTRYEDGSDTYSICALSEILSVEERPLEVGEMVHLKVAGMDKYLSLSPGRGIGPYPLIAIDGEYGVLKLREVTYAPVRLSDLVRA